MSTVAVINTNDDVVDMLRTILEHEGVDSVPGHVIDFKRGKADFEEFVERHNPKAIIYDIAPPYRENWEFFQALSQSEAGKNRRWVLTTTNKKLVTQAAGKDIGAYEISEKPYDLNEIVQAVKRLLVD
jgi:DNA-binding NtrC family response regulator